MGENFKSAGPSLVDLSLFAYSRQGKHSIALLAEMPDDVILLLNCTFYFEMTLEGLSEEHLHSPDHAPPSVVGLNLLDSFAVGEPECGSKNKQKFILIFCGVLLAKQMGWWAVLANFDEFAMERGQVGVFEGVEEVGLELANLGVGGG